MVGKGDDGGDGMEWLVGAVDDSSHMYNSMYPQLQIYQIIFLHVFA
jgi:hypothetical protein